jgi:SAM-dependent methyltransferase
VDAPAYNRMGIDYSDIRRADPRLEAAIHEALGPARTVLNVGAGAGSYEPRDREVIAIEPSPVMIAQRPPEAAAAMVGFAESLPLDDRSVDATMGVFTMQHWNDVEAGLGEVVRVTRERVVMLTLDLDVAGEMWLLADYAPEIDAVNREMFPSLATLRELLPEPEVMTVPVPADCSDGFCLALWSRPEAHLDPGVRRGSSIWHLVPDAVTERIVGALRADLESGAWDRRHGRLRGLDSLDVGLRLVRAEL